jgi:Fic family protein
MTTNIQQQIQAKKSKLDTLRPLSDEQLQRLKSYFDIEFTYNSNAIEGNTLSFSETKLVINEGLTIGGKSLSEHLEAINHKEAIDFIEALSQQRAITLKEIKELHYLILKGIDTQNAGAFRTIEVGVRKSDGEIHKFCDPLKVPEKMQEFIEAFNAPAEDIPTQAAKLHLEFVTIHPFSDGNGRCARLLMNLKLLQEGYPLTIIHVQERIAYIQAIEEYQQTNDDTVFVEFVAKKVDESLTKYIELIHTKVI